MQLKQYVVPTALASLLAVPLLPPLSAAFAVPDPTAIAAAAAATPASVTALAWQPAASSKTRVSVPGTRRDGASVHRAKARVAGAVRVRTEATRTSAAPSYTVSVRTSQQRRVVLRAVRPVAGRSPVFLTQQVKTVRAGAWTRLSVHVPATTTPQRVRVRIRVSGLRRGESILVSGHRTDRTSPSDTPTSSPSPGNEVPTAPPTPTRPTPPTTGSGTTAGTLTNGCTYSARGLPSCGSYLGMAYGSNTDPSTVEAQLGGRLGLRRTYYTASQVTRAVDTARTDLAKGRLPWISFKFPHGWKDMSTGAGDAWARDIATRLARLDGPVWVAFHHEPENDGDIAQWRAAQERLAPIIRSQAPNVAYTVVLTGWHQFYGPSQYSLANIWPRTTVDVAGFDIYNSAGVVKNGTVMKRTDMDAAYFAKIQAWAKTQKVAWGLAETGFTDAASTTDPDWIRRTHQQLDARGGVAMAYFNTTLNSIAPWHLSNTTKQQSYRDAQEGTPRLPVS